VKRTLLVILTLSVAIVATLVAIPHLQSHKVSRYCFDSENLGIRVTINEICNPRLLDLGTGLITASPSSDGKVHSLNSLLKNRFTAVQLVAERAGISLRITSGFRSYAKQAAMYKREVVLKGSETSAAHWVLPPRLSHHTQGVAIDIASANGDADMAWLSSHASSFGLCRTYANERWHYEGDIAPGESCPKMASSALVNMR
jgi:D-alanyl-D-alanine carboxypeptidase